MRISRELRSVVDKHFSKRYSDAVRLINDEDEKERAAELREVKNSQEYKDFIASKKALEKSLAKSGRFSVDRFRSVVWHSGSKLPIGIAELECPATDARRAKLRSEIESEKSGLLIRLELGKNYEDVARILGDAGIKL